MHENIALPNKQFLAGVVSNLVNVAGYVAVEVYVILTMLTKRISIGNLAYYTTALINYQNGIGWFIAHCIVAL